MDLLTLGFVIGLSIWSRRLARRPGAPAYLGRVWLVLAGIWAFEEMGLLATIRSLIHAFGSVAAVAPERKAQALADGISAAMYFTAAGMGLMVVTLVVAAVLLFRWQRRLPTQG